MSAGPGLGAAGPGEGGGGGKAEGRKGMLRAAVPSSPKLEPSAVREKALRPC